MRNYWSLRSSDVVVGLLFVGPVALAQFSKPDSIVPVPARREAAYLFPIQPGQPAMLNGTMGELRSTHFHGGLDINTLSIGYAVRSAQDGYISRAVVGTTGYGKALYVKHFDGNTTLYGHLDQFRGSLDQHIRNERYRRKQSEIDLYFSPGQFPVRRGDTIALSGNTGSSGGPHLHFELRSSDEAALNPMMLEFEEVQDHAPPVAQKLALKTLDINSRINDQFGRHEFYLLKSGDHYHLDEPILAQGRIGIEIQAYDKMENSRFRCGISRIELLANGKKVFSQAIDKINLRESRNALTVMDFKVLETRGARFNKLYIDDGNRLPYYAGTILRKGIQVAQQEVAVEIHLIDFHGNTSTVQFTLAPSPSTDSLDFLEAAGTPYAVDIQENTLTFSLNPCSPNETGETIELYANGKAQSLNPTYGGKFKAVYLIDLGKVLPDSIRSCAGTWVSHFRDRVPSGTKYKYFSDQVEIEFPVYSLYDTLYLTTSYDSTSGEIFGIGARTTPLQTSVRVSVKPLKTQTQEKSLGLYRKEGNGYSHVNSTWKNGRLHFSTLSLGEFVLMSDTVPPRIRPISLNSAVARLQVRDDLSGISYIEGNINGKWLLLNYDHKTGVIYSERLDHSKPLQGDFELKVVDHAGNESIYKQRIL